MNRGAASGYASTHGPVGAVPMGGNAPWSHAHEHIAFGGLNPPFAEGSMPFTSATVPVGYSTSLPPLDAHHPTSRAHSLGLHTDFEHVEHLQPMSSISEGQRRAETLRGSPAAAPTHGYPFEADLPAYSAAPSPIASSPSGLRERSFAQTPRSFSAGSGTSDYLEIRHHYLTAYSQPPSALSVHSVDNLSVHSGANSPSDRPPWLTRAQSPIGNYRATHGTQPSRYPVLEGVLPWLINHDIMPVIACDLLQHYFDDSSLTGADFYAPRSHGRVFRRRSVLHPSPPRACSSALLISMLCLAARTSPSPFFSSPQFRNEICQTLFNLANALSQQAGTRDEAESTAGRYGSQRHGPSTGGPYPSQRFEPDIRTRFTLDDVATYYHLAAVTTSSELGRDGSRWWNAAFSAARELGLGREPALQSQDASLRTNPGGSTSKRRANSNVEVSSRAQATSQWSGRATSSFEPLTDEQREERRRMWWVLFMTDRHLSMLDPTRDTVLHESECTGLAGPVDEAIWQSDEVYADPLGRSSVRSGTLT